MVCYDYSTYTYTRMHTLLCMYVCMKILLVNPPIIAYITPNQILDVLQTARVGCIATGYEVSYYWTIGLGSFPGKVTGINSSVLIIPYLRLSDDNTYTCVASNSGGKVNRTSRITVTGMNGDVHVYVVKLLYVCFTVNNHCH